MRICLVAHGFPPHERTGVENYTAALAAALAQRGHRVDVFAPRADPGVANFALRREQRPGYSVHWIARNTGPKNPREMLDVPEITASFAAFLDRERPEVVHFQHFIKLGVGLVHETRRRGIPSVYTAHDYYPVCHRYTLLRPDLAHCEIRGDSMACSRCDLALAFLNSARGLGDYQMGVLPEQLSAAELASLADVLGDEAQRADFSVDHTDAAHDLRLELDGLRAQAFAALDEIIAPTRYLADELVRGGIERGKIRVLPYGIENGDLVGLPPARAGAGPRVRFAFLGGLSKHKGVHVLLDAFRRMKGPAELVVWGDSTDRPYVEILRRAALEAGARLAGPYERKDLPRILTEVDVAVVPSIWVENYPLVIREAFSARRPVIASRFGAIPESVRDGVDGLLFPPGDAAALAEALSRCARESGLIERLAAAIEPVKSVEAQAAELDAFYAELAARKAAARAGKEPPPSVRAFQGRFERLRALPTSDLFQRALAGLERLRAGLASELGETGPLDLLGAALEGRSRAQEELRDARAEIAWLRKKFEVSQSDRAAILRMSEDLDRVLLATRTGSRRREEHLRSAEAYLETKDKALREVGGELEAAGRYIQLKEETLARTEDELRRAGEYIRTKEAELAQTGERLREKTAELERAGVDLREAERALEETGLRAALGEERLASTHENLRAAAEVGLTAVEAQERLLGRTLLPLLERMKRIAAPHEEPEPTRPDATFVELLVALRTTLATLEAIGKELAWRRAEVEWRREEMRRARDDTRGLIKRLLVRRTAVGRRVKEWDGGLPGGGGT